MSLSGTHIPQESCIALYFTTFLLDIHICNKINTESFFYHHITRQEKWNTSKVTERMGGLETDI